jgi:hypothetical protein
MTVTSHLERDGVQLLWRPTGAVSLVSNDYFGADTLGRGGRMRFHSDNSLQLKYLDDKDSVLSRGAFSVTVDAGCENGDHVQCLQDSKTDPRQAFLGFMVYNRFWFDKDLFGLTLGGGAMTNPGRYLVLLPPVNGETAASGSPYFTANPGDKFMGWDASVTFDYMPSQYITFRWEGNHRASNIPYFAGAGGVTPPGGNQGAAGSTVAGWSPDLRKDENRTSLVLMVRL